MNTKIGLYIYLCFLISKILTIEILKKHESISVSCSQKKFVFDANGFNLNDEMFLKFAMNKDGLEDKIYYDFYIELNSSNIESYDYTTLSPTTEKSPGISSKSNKNKKTTSLERFYTIKKEQQTQYALIQFKCSASSSSHSITIENTEEDEGNKYIVLIAVICSVVEVLAIAGIIIGCIRRKKRQALRAAERAAKAQAAQAAYDGSAGVAFYPQAGPVPIIGFEGNYPMNNMPPPGNYGPQLIPYANNNSNMNFGQNVQNYPNNMEPTSEKRAKF